MTQIFSMQIVKKRCAEQSEAEHFLDLKSEN